MLRQRTNAAAIFSHHHGREHQDVKREIYRENRRCHGDNHST